MDFMQNQMFYPTAYGNYIPNSQTPIYAHQSISQNNVQPNNTNMNWIRVPNVDMARNVSVQPNQTAWIMLENDNSISVKAADPSGLTSQRFFKMIEYTPGEEVSSSQSKYVTKEEFDEFKKQFMKSEKKTKEMVKND